VENPWLRLPTEPPYVLPEDEAAVREFNAKADEDCRLLIDDFLPEPFVGNPAAPVILLLNNPGCGSKARFRQEAPFIKRMRDNLVHRASDCSFAYFADDVNPDLKLWWNKKLKGLLACGLHHGVLAEAICAVDYFPYPSKRFRGWKGRLLSGAQDYSFDLVRKAIQREAVIVLVRGKRRWLKAAPELDGYKRLCKVSNPQVGSISQKNCKKFKRVVRAIKANAG
jgi:hypothetical protein